MTNGGCGESTGYFRPQFGGGAPDTATATDGRTIDPYARTEPLGEDRSRRAAGRPRGRSRPFRGPSLPYGSGPYRPQSRRVIRASRSRAARSASSIDRSRSGVSRATGTEQLIASRAGIR